MKYRMTYVQAYQDNTEDFDAEDAERASKKAREILEEKVRERASFYRTKQRFHYILLKVEKIINVEDIPLDRVG